MRRLNSSWRGTLVGFAMLVEVAFPKDYCDTNGFGIRCICRWKNKKGHSRSINDEGSVHYWAPGKAVQKSHMFVFCDVNMRPSTTKRNYSDIWADLVVFEFFLVDKKIMPLGDGCTVTRCGVHVIHAATRNTNIEHIPPVLSLDPLEFSGNEVKEVLRVSYDGLLEGDKALFLYLASLFNDEDACLVAPLIASNYFGISTGLKVLANSSLIHVSSSGQIGMHCLLRNMGKEILHRQCMLPSSSNGSRSWKYDVYTTFSEQDVSKSFLNNLFAAFMYRFVITYKNRGTSKLVSYLHSEQGIRETKIIIVVFSKKYASSKWLLNELVKIAKSMKELNQTVIPIFYDVDPVDIRNQTGEFGKQIKQLCIGKTEDEKQQWCLALADIADLRGYKFLNCDQSEDEFIELFAENVKRLVNNILMDENAYYELKEFIVHGTQ